MYGDKDPHCALYRRVTRKNKVPLPCQPKGSLPAPGGGKHEASEGVTPGAACAARVAIEKICCV